MAARRVAAATGYHFRCFLNVFLFVFLLLCFCVSRGHPFYSRHELLIVGLQCEQAVTSDFVHLNNIPEEIARTPGSPWIVVGSNKRRRRRRYRKQKRGCRSGIFARLKRRPHKPPLPSMLLTNARSIVNKIDELNLWISSDKLITDCHDRGG